MIQMLVPTARPWPQSDHVARRGRSGRGSGAHSGGRDHSMLCAMPREEGARRCEIDTGCPGRRVCGVRAEEHQTACSCLMTSSKVAHGLPSSFYPITVAMSYACLSACLSVCLSVCHAQWSIERAQLASHVSCSCSNLLPCLPWSFDAQPAPPGTALAPRCRLVSLMAGYLRQQTGP